MSIRSYIVGLEKAGKLTRCVFPGRPSTRRIYLTVEAARDMGPDGIVNLMNLRGDTEAGLKRWVHGGLVYVGLDGKPRFLKPLCPPPPEIWELRFTDPRVQLRLFCRFAEPNTLIGTKFHTRQMLGKKGSRDWNSALQQCVTKWNELFPNHEVFSASSIDKYVTENCDDFPLCT